VWATLAFLVLCGFGLLLQYKPEKERATDFHAL
jgi:hypothetical protein